MDTKLVVKGMHCDSCKALVQMELEDKGLGEQVKHIDLEGDNTGVIELQNVEEETVLKVKKIINQMENYEIE